MTQSFYVTTPIYYVNDSPHIGHAYTTIACDALARFMRLDGHDVKFLTGTDEHGQKVDKAARAAGKDPKAFCDEVSKRFLALVKGGENLLNVSNDDFIRTTEERHTRACQELWRRIEASGNIYLGKYAGWYAVRDEAYYQESELVNGKAPTGAEVEWTEEESYFFKLSAFQEKLLTFYEERKDFIVPEARYNEVVSFVKGGLRDLSISRTSFSWGIPLPPGGESNREKHVMYVWIDALTNYLTALGWPEETPDYKKFWADPESTGPVHVIGKDILRFHAVYWPAFLMAADLPLPKKIVSHGWWTIEGEKMSKSLGNVIAPKELIDAYGLDPVRYFLLREVPFGNDGNFSRENLVTRVNAELANNIGNLAQRTLSMIQKNCGGRVPEKGDAEANEYKVNQANKAHYEHIANAMRANDFVKAIDMIIDLAAKSNAYIDKQAPWVLKKENPQRMGEVLYLLAEKLRWISIFLQPFCPAAAGKMLDQLAVSENERSFAHLTERYALKPGTTLPPPQGVFPRIETGEKRG